MKKYLFIVILILGLASCGKAQHCGWDNTDVIILDVRDSLTGAIINGLEIILADSTGKPYTSKWNLKNYKNLTFYQNTDTLKFGQNIKPKYKLSPHTAGPFPFCVDCYMLLVYFNNYPNYNSNGKDQIIIRDIDGEQNLGLFEDTSILFDRINISNLCTANPIWDFNQVYANSITIQVTLNPKEPQSILSNSEINQKMHCSDLKGNWKISKIISEDEKVYSMNQIINFDGHCGGSYHLDVNHCNLGFDIFGEDSIKFFNPVCTEKCCDSEFAELPISILTQMNQIISFDNDQISLKGVFPNNTNINPFNQLSGAIQVVLEKQ
jgi:hypothetical protein